MMANEVTRDGQTLIKDWLATVERKMNMAREYARASEDEKTAHDRLALWIAPDDMQVGEKIGVWQGDSLFQCERTGINSYMVKVRTRGHGFYKLTM